MSVYYNDLDPYCCKVLEKNIRAGNLPGGWVDGRDIRTVRASDLMGYRHIHLFAGIGVFALALRRAGVSEDLSIITGGFPCQDISNAGKREGITGERSGLWSEMARLIRDLRPDYALVENVSALVNRGLSTVLGDLAEAGYDAEWCCLRASDFGAPHRRERLFLLAYPMREGQPPIGNRIPARTDSPISPSGTGNVAYPGRRGRGIWKRSNRQQTGTQVIGRGEKVADPQSAEWQWSGESGTALSRSSAKGRTEPQSYLCGNVDGPASWLDRYRWPAGPGAEQHAWEPPRTVSGKQPHRVARLKALGNSMVVPCAEYMARLIIEREKGNRDGTEEEASD